MPHVDILHIQKIIFHNDIRDYNKLKYRVPHLRKNLHTVFADTVKFNDKCIKILVGHWKKFHTVGWKINQQMSIAQCGH